MCCPGGRTSEGTGSRKKSLKNCEMGGKKLCRKKKPLTVNTVSGKSMGRKKDVQRRLRLPEEKSR